MTPRNSTRDKPLNRGQLMTGPKKGPGIMTNADAELEKLKEAVRVACQRVTQVIQTVADPAAIKAATDICAEAVEALRVYTAKMRTRR